MREYPLKLPNMEKERYMELKWFCRQYPEKKRRMADAINLSSPRMDGMPVQTGLSDPVAYAVERRELLAEDVAAVEQAAEAAGTGLANWLILGACYGAPFERMPVPCTRRMYFEARRRFFGLLDELLKRKRVDPPQSDD